MRGMRSRVPLCKRVITSYSIHYTKLYDDRFDRRQNANVEPLGVFILQVLLDFGDDLRVMPAFGVEPEHRRGVGEARAAHPELDPILDRRIP